MHYFSGALRLLGTMRTGAARPAQPPAPAPPQ